MVQPTKPELPELADALRDVVLAVRRHTPGEGHDKAAFALLSHLVTLGPVRAADLAERACLDPSTVSRHLRGLEDAGYLERKSDPDDRRATLLSVSPTGHALVTTTLQHRAELFEKAVATWPQHDIRTLTRLTRRLADDLENQ